MPWCQKNRGDWQGVKAEFYKNLSAKNSETNQ